MTFPNRAPITATDERNPFAEYNEQYEAGEIDKVETARLLVACKIEPKTYRDKTSGSKSTAAGRRMRARAEHKFEKIMIGRDKMNNLLSKGKTGAFL